MLARNTTLKELDLSNNVFGNPGLIKLAQTLLSNRSLRVIRLDHNNLSDVSLFHLAQALRRNAALEELYLGSNSFRLDECLFFDADMNTDVTAAEAMACTLKKNATLSILDLSWNFNALTQAMEPLTDAMKTCPTLLRLNIAGTHLTDDCVLCLAEMVAASSGVKRTIDMRNCGVEAKRTKLACAFRVYDHEATLLGVDYGNLPLVQELAAQLQLLEKLLSRPTVATFPNHRVSQFVLLDGRFVQLHWDPTGVFVRGRLVYANGDSLAFDTVRIQAPGFVSRLRASCCCTGQRAPGGQQRAALGQRSAQKQRSSALNSAVVLAGNYVMVNGQGFNLDKVMAVVSAVLNVIDFFLDLIVLATLAAGSNSGSFYLTLIVLVFATLAQSVALLQDGRHLSALLQLFSASVLLDAFNFVVRGRADGVQLPLRTSQPMQGLAAIYRLKLAEAMLESIPQVLLQSYLAMSAVRNKQSLQTVLVLLLSIAVAILSVVTSLVQSDIGVMTSWRKSAERKIVTVPTIAVALSALYRLAETVSNLALVALFAIQSPSVIQWVGGVLGAKALCIVVYWRFNFSHIGEVATSLFVYPGSETVCFDWIKDVRRLPTWVYVSIQLVFDVGMIGLLVAYEPMNVLESNSEFLKMVLYGTSAACVLKYIIGFITMFLHTQKPHVLYKDRREALTCGLLKFSEEEANDDGAEVQVRGRKVAVSKEAAAMLAGVDPEKSVELQMNPMSQIKPKSRRASSALNPLAALQRRASLAGGTGSTGGSPQNLPQQSSGGSGGTAPKSAGSIGLGQPTITSGSSEANLTDSQGRRVSHFSSAQFLSVSPGQRQPAMFTSMMLASPSKRGSSSPAGAAAPAAAGAEPGAVSQSLPNRTGKRFRLSIAPRSTSTPGLTSLPGRDSRSSSTSGVPAGPPPGQPTTPNSGSRTQSRGGRLVSALKADNVAVDLGDFG